MRIFLDIMLEVIKATIFFAAFISPLLIMILLSYFVSIWFMTGFVVVVPTMAIIGETFVKKFL